MKKETFHTKWYYRLLRVLFFGSYILFAIILTLLGYFESDVEISGLFWSLVLAFIYWAIKKIFYYIFFGDSLLPIIDKK